MRSLAAMLPTTSEPPMKDERRRRASGFLYWLDVQTRWSDNDQYGHINNAVYYRCADAAINAYLLSHCGLLPYRQPSDPPPKTEAEAKADVLGLMVSTSATYYAPATFPSLLRVGMRVIKLGQSSVRFELGFFEMPDPTAGKPLSTTLATEIQVPQAVPLPANALAVALSRATHVYVDRKDRRPVRPMPEAIFKGLDALKVPELEENVDKPLSKL